MDDIINLFRKEHSIYNKTFQFHVILFFLVVLLFLTRLKLSGKSTFILVSLIFALYLSNIYVKVNQDDLKDNNKLTYFKLQSLQIKVNDYLQYKIKQSSNSKRDNIQLMYEKNKLDSIYIDSNLIIFLYSIIKLSEYNLSEFYLLLKGTNNILKLKDEIEKYYESNKNYPQNISEMLQIAINLKINCLNNLQNFIYSVPKTNVMYKYIDNSIIEYNILITKNIKMMYKYHLDYIKINGINNTTVFVNINSTKGFDIISNYSVIPGKKENIHKLIDLYV